MSDKSKLIYLGILLNIRKGVYATNQDQLRQDLLKLRYLLTIEKDNQKMQVVENKMKLMLKKCWHLILIVL